jgi:hypothetical protein
MAVTAVVLDVGETLEDETESVSAQVDFVSSSEGPPPEALR